MLAEALGFADMSEEELRDLIAEFDPYPELGTRHSAELHAWWNARGLGAAAIAAAEDELIRRAQGGHRDRAAREVERRGERSPDPVAIVREVHGEPLADWVERRATVLASTLEGRPRKELVALTQAAQDRIERDGGLVSTHPDTMVQATALQFLRNSRNERVAQRQERQATTRQVRDGGVADGLEM